MDLNDDFNNDNDNHETYRNEARKKLRSYTNKMQDYMKSKSSLDFNIGDIVALKIPANNRFKTDRPNLICKIIEKLPKNNYKLGCKFRILDISYTIYFRK